MSHPPSPAEQPRLSEVLRDLGLSGAAQKRALRSGKVSVQGVPVSDGGRRVAPESVRHTPDAPRIHVGRDVAFLWRDGAVVVVWKPAGMLSVSAPRRRREHTVLGTVRRQLGSAWPVHRLDEETSGLMLVALTEAAQHGLKEALAARHLTRRYLALVDGHMDGAPHTVRSTLVRNRGDGKRGSWTRPGAPPEGARDAVTHLQRLEVLRRGASLVGARLETGRTHQVRIHAAEAGHAVLGDRLYGSMRSTRRAERLALHAAELIFAHPHTGERMRFSAPLADDLEVLRRTLSERPSHS